MTHQTTPNPRPTNEIQKAHDILIAVLLGDLPIPIDAAVRADIHAATDTLCWVLQHNHNPTFAQNLQKIQTWATQNNYTLQEPDH